MFVALQLLLCAIVASYSHASSQSGDDNCDSSSMESTWFMNKWQIDFALPPAVPEQEHCVLYRKHPDLLLSTPLHCSVDSEDDVTILDLVVEFRSNSNTFQRLEFQTNSFDTPMPQDTEEIKFAIRYDATSDVKFTCEGASSVDGIKESCQVHDETLLEILNVVNIDQYFAFSVSAKDKAVLQAWVNNNFPLDEDKTSAFFLSEKPTQIIIMNGVGTKYNLPVCTKQPVINTDTGAVNCVDDNESTFCFNKELELLFYVNQHDRHKLELQMSKLLDDLGCVGDSDQCICGSSLFSFHEILNKNDGISIYMGHQPAKRKDADQPAIPKSPHPHCVEAISETRWMGSQLELKYSFSATKSGEDFCLIDRTNAALVSEVFCQQHNEIQVSSVHVGRDGKHEIVLKGRHHSGSNESTLTCIGERRRCECEVVTSGSSFKPKFRCRLPITKDYQPGPIAEFCNFSSEGLTNFEGLLCDISNTNLLSPGGPKVYGVSGYWESEEENTQNFLFSREKASSVADKVAFEVVGSGTTVTIIVLYTSCLEAMLECNIPERRYDDDRSNDNKGPLEPPFDNPDVKGIEKGPPGRASHEPVDEGGSEVDQPAATTANVPDKPDFGGGIRKDDEPPLVDDQDVESTVDIPEVEVEVKIPPGPASPQPVGGGIEDDPLAVAPANIPDNPDVGMQG